MNKFQLNRECSISDLTGYGFKKVGTGYKLSVPLYTYNKQSVISAIFNADFLDEHMRVDIRNSSGSLYGAYYDREFSNPDKNSVLATAIRKLEKEVQSLYSKNIIIEVID